MAAQMARLFARKRSKKEDYEYDYDKKVLQPSLTSPFVEPYHKCALLGPLKSDVIFHVRALTSLSLATQQLQNQLPNDRVDDQMHVEYFLERNAFEAPTDKQYVTIAGDGLTSICMNLHHGDNHHEIVSYHHETEKVEPLGALPLNGFYGNFGFVDGRWGCCVHQPGVLCQLTPDGDFVVVFGPQEFAHGVWFPKDIPVLLVYQVSPAKLVFERNCQKIPFVKCNPISISICPVSLRRGKYCIAMITESMEIRLWDAQTTTGTIAKLESAKPFIIHLFSRGNPYESCIRFSPDGRCLCVICYMENEDTSACVILDAQNLEALCWMHYEERYTWLRWIFPIFSACGTEMVWATYWDRDNQYDLSKSELLFHKIPYPTESLKMLCRVVILKHVQPSSLNELSLPDGLVEFLANGCSTPINTLPIVEPTEQESQRCKCALM